MRRTFLAANWKMNTTSDEAEKLAVGSREMSGLNVDVVLCPPFIWLERVRENISGTDIKLGAQDVYWEDWGAYTGEISPLQLRELCEYVIVGHSERRNVFGESDEEVARKRRAVSDAGMVPILAVGENEREHDERRTEEVVRRQLLSGLDRESHSDVIIAYEPVWAIGSGKPASPEHAERIAGSIREQLEECGYRAEDARILYGGSVTPDTFGDFMDQPNIDGALVGGASLNADEFAALGKIAANSV